MSQDYAKALQWFEKAAQQDNAKAQYNLSHIYVNDQGVRQNDAHTKE